MEIGDKDRIKKYPANFGVYKCPSCGEEKDGWMLTKIEEGMNMEQIVMANFFNYHLEKRTILYDQFIDEIINTYPNEGLKRDSIRQTINDCYTKLIDKNIIAVRHPIDREASEQYVSIKIDSINKIETFFNKKIIKQWTFKYFNTDLKKIRELIESNPNIRYKERWLVAVDHFLN